ncbi:MAG TPA: hypothetical protein VJU84_08595 [Pyrinomonadaceae bacterium]|nr:hypothetical protein [Pyrinomonadaceae bacterium]
MPGFNFFVSGIEDGMLQLLNTLSVKADPPGYLKTIDSYGGQLDESTIKKYLEQLVGSLPLALVSYGGGEEVLSPAVAPVFGEPRIIEHRCTFGIIWCSGDARGEKAQRTGPYGVYRMIEDGKNLFGGRQFRRNDPDNDDAPTLLTLDPLTEAGIDFVARLPGLTAYMQHFDTRFKWTEPDRRVAGIGVDELIFDVTPLGEASEPGGKPGVILE